MRYIVIFITALFCCAAAGAQTPKRVIAESEQYFPSGVITDSIRYKYSSNRRSVYHYGAATFDYHYRTRWFIYSQNFEGFNPGGSYDSYFSPDVQADSIWSYVSTSQGLVANDTIASAYFGKRLLMYYDPYFDNNGNFVMEQFNNKYNLQGQIIERKLMRSYPSATSMNDFCITFFNYDSQGRHESEQTPVNPGDSRVVHTYNADGRELMTAMVTESSYGFLGIDSQQKWWFTYYPDGKVQTILVRELLSATAGSTVPLYRDSFAYDNGVDFYTKRWRAGYSPGGSPVSPMSLMEERTLNAQNLPDTVRSKEWKNGGWEYTDRIFTYDSDNDPVSWVSYVNNVSNKIHYFYYETFDTTTSVHNVAPTADMVVYPNPANEALNITWRNNNGSKLTTELFNVVGQQVAGLTEVWRSNIQHIPIQHLGAGVYVLSVKDEDGVVVFRERVVKE